jgi:uncharacterized protein (TIGR03067 family)
VVESVVRDPREKQADEGRGLKIVVKGAKAVFKVPAGDMLIGGFVIKIDPTKRPKTVDIWSDESSFGKSVEDTLKGPPVLAIYELDGDTLRVCWAPVAKRDRPTEFAAKTGSGHGLVVLKREKP